MVTRKTKPPPTPAEVMRREVAAANRDKHESAYFLHVVLPLTALGYPRPKAQAMLIPGHRHRVDYAYLQARIAVEIHGQIWHKGGHTSGRGLTRDAFKANELACIGWKLLVFTPEMIESGEAREWTERALRRAGVKGVAS